MSEKNSIWLQSCDFESQTNKPGEFCVQTALEVFHSIDWDAHRKEYNAKLLEQEEVCPAGLGINLESSEFFHIHLGPEDSDSWELHMHIKQPVKFLWVKTSAIKTYCYEVKDLSHMPRLIEDFLSDNQQQAWQYCQENLKSL